MMLILTRRATEQIRVGDSIVVAILGVKGNQVRIGIEAPKNIAVDREEIYRRKAGEASDLAALQSFSSAKRR